MLRKLVLLLALVLLFSCTVEDDFISNTNVMSLEKPVPQRWVLDHYTNNSNRIGIWPYLSGNDYLIPFSDYKNKYGFTDVLVHHHEEIPLAAMYFDRWSTMILISDNGSWKSQIQNNDVTRYYIDEPIETQGIDTTLLREMYDSVKAIRSDATLILGSATRELSTHSTIQQYREFINFEQPKMYMLFSSYSEHDGGQEFWWEQYWQQPYFGTHSRSNWIGAYHDRFQYSSLLNKADDLGLTRIWYYIGGDGGADNVSEFAYHLWEEGWLDERIERCELTGQHRVADRLWYDDFPDAVD